MAALASGATFFTDEAFLGSAETSQEPHSTMPESNPLVESVVLKHARSELQKMGIDESIPDHVLKSFVREVKVKNPPSPARPNIVPTDSFLAEDAGVGSSLPSAFSEPFLPDSPSALHFDSSRGLFVLRGRPIKISLQNFSNRLNKRRARVAVVNSCFPIRMIIFFPVGLDGPEELSIAESPLHPTENLSDHKSPFGSTELSSQIYRRTRTPSAPVGYGPYKFNTVESKKMQKSSSKKSKSYETNRAKYPFDEQENS